MIRARRTGLALLCLTVFAVMASPAMAADGVGLYGRTDDKVITFGAFIIMGFFVVLVVGLSLLQNRAENRKDREREELDRLRRD